MRLATSAESHHAEFVRAYQQTIRNAAATLVEFESQRELLEALEQGEVDFGFASGSSAYFAYRPGGAVNTATASVLRGIAILQPETLYLVARRDAGDLARARSLTIGAEREVDPATADLLLTIFGRPPPERSTGGHGSEITMLAPLTEAAAVAAFESGTLDVFVCRNDCSAGVRSFLGRGARLLQLERQAIDRLRHAYPFLRLVSVAAGTFPQQPMAIWTVAIDTVLVSRRDVHEPLVYELTQQLVEALPQIAAAVKVYQMPATPLPLHPGAARYYREWELIR